MSGVPVINLADRKKIMADRFVVYAAFFSILVLLTSGAVVDAQGTQDVDRYTTIKKIEVAGNRRISAAAIKSTIVTKEGDIYSAETIGKDVDAIWSLGFFDDIKVEVDAFEGGIKVVFRIYERPVVGSIVFIGNNKISEKKLKESIDLLENDDLKRYLLKLDEDKVRELYHEKGFLFVKVSTEEKITNGRTSIIYHISEGPLVRIAEIKFKGNRSIRSKLLRRIMNTAPKRFPSIFFRGNFDKEVFESDVANIKQYYRQKGWLDAEVDWESSYSRDKTLMYLTVNVNENERYFVDKITAEGNTIFSNKEILESLQLVEGGPFLLELLQKDIFEMRLLYGEQGFSNVEIAEKHYFGAGDTNVSIVYSIKENERIFIEKVKITGNDKTKDNVIRRQLTFFPGEYLNVAKIRDSQQLLTNTGYFDMESGAPVSINFEPGSRSDTQNVLVDVKEGRSGTLRFGGGFGANVGIFGDVSYTDRNFDVLDVPKDLTDLVSGNAFRGAGHVFNIRVAPGLQRQEASISVFNPAVYDSPFSAGFSLSSFGRSREDFDEKRKSAKINIGKRVNRNVSIGLTPAIEVITVGDIGVDDRDGTGKFANVALRRIVPQDVFDVEGDHTKLGIEMKANISTRDNPFLPSKGVIGEVSFEISTLDVEIVKFVMVGRRYSTVYKSPKKGKHTLMLGGSIGLVETTSGEDVPIFERFFAGGTGSIRGFRFRGASPIEDNQQVGGNALLLGTMEYNFPVIKKVVRGVAFLDAGKADKDIADLNFSNFRAAVGFGVRLSLPIFGRAVISLDWAFPVVQQDGDELQRFSFNVGQGGG